MTTIFLSYRKDDTRGEAARLADDLKPRLGTGAVFRDVLGIRPGIPFDAALKDHLASSRVVLVLIGLKWSEELQARLAQTETDYVRLEVATALAQDKRVIPLLVHGAALPAAQELPPDLAPLVTRQAMTIRDESWAADVDRLVKTIGTPYRWGLLALRSMAALLLIPTAVWLALPMLPPDRLTAQLLVIALIGAFVLVETYLAFSHRRRIRELQPPTRL